MKKLLIPTILALFLTACGAANSPTDAPLEVNSDTVLDDQLFQEATSANDLAKCEAIADSTKKDECKMVVQSFLTTAEAVAKLDASLCKDITEERYRENCESSIDTAIEDKEALAKAAEEAVKKSEEVSEIGNKAINEGDADICDAIEDQNQKYSCRYNVITNQAIAAKDPSLCEKIGEESSIQQCKKNVEQSQ